MNFKPGDFVWVRRDPLPFWPAKIVSHKKYKKQILYEVQFFKDSPNQEVEESDIMDYRQHQEENRPSKQTLRRNKRLASAMEAVEKALISRSSKRRRKSKQVLYKQKFEGDMDNEWKEAQKQEILLKDEELYEPEEGKNVLMKGQRKNPRKVLKHRKLSVSMKKNTQNEQGEKNKKAEEQDEQNLKSLDKNRPLKNTSGAKLNELEELKQGKRSLSKIQTILEEIFFRCVSAKTSQNSSQNSAFIKEQFALAFGQFRQIKDFKLRSRSFGAICGMLNYFSTQIHPIVFAEQLVQMKRWIKKLNKIAIDQLNSTVFFERVASHHFSRFPPKDLQQGIGKGVPTIVIIRVQNQISTFIQKKVAHLDLPFDAVHTLIKKIEVHLAESMQKVYLEDLWKDLRLKIKNLRQIKSLEEIEKLLSKA